jgi:peptidoglycan hydrolase CwlO-like protein
MNYPAQKTWRMLKSMRFPIVAAFLAASVLGCGIAWAQTTASSSASDLQAQIDENNTQINQLNTQIAQYQTQIKQDESSKQTLQGAINTLNLQTKEVTAQVSSTQKQISTTNLKIKQLGTGIATAKQQITVSQSALADGIRSLAENDTEPFMLQLLSSSSLDQAWQEAEQDIQVQDGIQNQVTQLETQKSALSASQTTSEQQEAQLAAQKQKLAAQQTSLTATGNQKKELLAETNSNEATYQQLLSQAQAQLQSFSTFAQNATSQGILTNQTSCDSWGCYYNQRDSEWGDDALDGSQFTMKSDGCLVTSLAMVMTHYGYSGVTPITINTNPADFAAYYPADLLITDVPIAGATVTRVSVGTSEAKMDAVLATGNPLIVGIHAYGGTHYIVFVSGSKGNYIMRDPYQPNAKDVPFTQYYSLGEIFSSAKVQIS